MHDPSKLLQTLLPLVIFIIWMIISAAANARKKPYGGRTQRPNPIPQGDSERTSESPSQKTENKKTDWPWPDNTAGRDNDNNSQETVSFPEMPVPEKPAPATTLTSAPVLSSDMLQKAMSFVEDDGAIRDEIASGPRRLSREHYLEINISHNEMRKAMIWSEILAPLLGLREQK